MDVFELNASLRLDSSDYENKLKNAEKRGKEAASSVSGSLKNTGSGADSAFGKVVNGLNKAKDVSTKTVQTVAKATTKVANGFGKASNIMAGAISGASKKMSGIMQGASKMAVNGVKGIVTMSGKAANGIGVLAKSGVSAMGTLAKASLSVTEGIVNIGKQAVKVASVAGAAVAAVAVPMIKSATAAYAQYEQLEGGIETLFKEGASRIVLENSNKSYMTTGFSQNQYLDIVTSFASSMVQGTGKDYVKAAELSDLALIDMADNANKMGSSLESVQNAYRGFSKQTFTMLDNLKLGYGGTKSEMERLLKDAEEIKLREGEVVDYSIDNFADIVNAIHVIQKELGITGTTQLEAETTISGSLNRVKAAWSDLMKVVAGKSSSEEINEAIDRFRRSLDIFLDKNLLPTVRRAIFGVRSLIISMVPKLAQRLPDLLLELLEGIITIGFDLGMSLIRGITDAIVSRDWIATFKKAGARLKTALLGSLGYAPSDNATWEDVRKALIKEIGERIGKIKVKLAKWLGVVGPDGTVESASWIDVAVALGVKIGDELYKFSQYVKFRLAQWTGLIDKDVPFTLDGAQSVNWAEVAANLGGLILGWLQAIGGGVKFMLAKWTGTIDPDTPWSMDKVGDIKWEDIAGNIGNWIMSFIGPIKWLIASWCGLVEPGTKYELGAEGEIKWEDIATKIGEMIGELALGAERVAKFVIGQWVGVVTPGTKYDAKEAANLSWIKIAAALGLKIKKLMHDAGVGIRVALALWTGVIDENTDVNADNQSIKWSDIFNKLGDAIKEKILNPIKVSIAAWVGVLEPDANGEIDEKSAKAVKWEDILTALGKKIPTLIENFDSYFRVTIAKIFFDVPSNVTFEENSKKFTWTFILARLRFWILDKLKNLKVRLGKWVLGLGANAELDDKDVSWGTIARGIATKIGAHMKEFIGILLGFTDADGNFLNDTTWKDIGEKILRGIASASRGFSSFLKELIMGDDYQKWVKDKNEEPSWFDAFNNFYNKVDKELNGEQNLFKSITDLAVNGATFWMAFVGGFVVALAKQLPTFVNELVKSLSEEGVAEQIAEDLNTIVTKLLDAAPALVDFVMRVLQGIVDDPEPVNGLTNFIGKLIDIMAERLPGITDSITDRFGQLVEWIAKPETWDTIFNLFEGMIGGLGKNTSKLTMFFVELITGVLTNWKIWNTIIRLFLAAIVQGLAGVLDAVVTLIAELINPGSTYDENGNRVTMFTKWGVYEWINSVFGLDKPYDPDNPSSPDYQWTDKTPVNLSGAASDQAAEDVNQAAQSSDKLTDDEKTLFNGIAHAIGASRGYKGHIYRGNPAKVDSALKAIIDNPEYLAFFARNGGNANAELQDYIKFLKGEKKPNGDNAWRGFHGTGTWGNEDTLGLLEELYYQSAIHIGLEPDMDEESLAAIQARLAGKSFTVVAKVVPDWSDWNFQTGGQSWALWTHGEADSTGMTSGEYANYYYGNRTSHSPLYQPGKGVIPNYAKGLWNVPYDNYTANLHRDEMILTPEQARDYREGRGGGGEDIVAAINGLRNDMQNIKLVVGQKVFGKTVVDYSGQRMAGYIGQAEDRAIAGYGWG